MLNPMPAQVDRRPLISYLRLQSDAERRITSHLQAAAINIERELKRLERRATGGIGDAVRMDQLAKTKAAIHRELAAHWRKTGHEIDVAREEAAAAAVETMYPGDMLRQVMPEADRKYLMRSAEDSAKRGIVTAEARMNLSRIPLSDKVWQEEMLTNGKLDAIINNALYRGASAADLAKDVRAYVNPNTPGGVRYASHRLARTEINNAFHATQVQEGINSPWVNALKWNLSGSHPRPDECNEYAESSHFSGGGQGEFRPEETPQKPHPNCFCYTTPVTPSREDFIKQFQAGVYDEFLESAA